ncbi:MAG: hypothetical protein IK080_00835 [Clostridia bacterium]|nr:hypothetical protein [Clostridia bacterium]
MKKLVPVLAALCAVLAAAIVVTVVLRGRGSPTPEETTAAAKTSVSAQARTSPSDRPAKTTAPQATETSAATTEAATTADPAAWQAAYRAYLAAYESEDWIEPKFALIYLDADDVPELAVCDGSYHAAGWKILTWLDGLKEIGEFGGWGNFFYYERAGMIYSSYGNHGAWTANLYQVRDGEAESVWEGKGDLDEDGNEIFFDADDNPISEEEYNAQMDAVTPSGAQEQQLSYDEDGYFITEANIETYIR